MVVFSIKPGGAGLKEKRHNKFINFLQIILNFLRPNAGFIKMKSPYKISWLYVAAAKRDNLKKIRSLEKVKKF